MRFALVSDTFPPMRTSGAVQLRDLSREFVRQGHQITVMLPSASIKTPWALEEQADGVEVLRLRAPKIKDVGYLRRTINELWMPFSMLLNLRKCPSTFLEWDGVIWYSPSIFHGPFVRKLKKESRSKGYLIIRDIFPDWAVDMGLINRGLSYRFFDGFARYQYSVADIIGVQTEGNRRYFEKWSKQTGRSLEVLNNWLDSPAQTRCSIRIDKTLLAGKKVFVYAGNMGVAQGMDIVLGLAASLMKRSDVGFAFVGRGTEVSRLRALALAKGLSNVQFFDEIDPDEIPGLYSQCVAGIVLLDPKHKSHNIPGKFLTYMQSGLPVLANLNHGNDLVNLVREAQVGQVCENGKVVDLVICAETLLTQIESDVDMSTRCKDLFAQEFSSAKAVRQIVDALN